MIGKLIITVISICLVFSCKKTNKNKRIIIHSVDQNKTELVNDKIDSLSILFDDLNRYYRDYAFKYNLEKNYPKYIKRVKKLNDSINNKYYNGLLRLAELYSTANKYSDSETDSINNEILNKIFSKSQLLEIRNLYKSKITTDSTKSNEYNIKELINTYNKIDFYIQKQIYFRDSLMSKFWELCPQYYKLMDKISSLKEHKNDSLKKQLLDVRSPHLQNEKFIRSILKKDRDSLAPSYLKTISPIIETNNNTQGIYNTETDYYADKQIFEKSEISKKLVYKNDIFSTEFIEDPLIIKSKDSIEIYAYSTEGRYKIKELSFGYQPNECIGAYYVFPIRNINKKLLFSSPYQLEIEYNHYPRIDSIIKSQNPNICRDCPNGWSNLKAYGKLKGYDDIYFLMTSIREIDDTETFIRAIYLVNKKNDAVKLWSSEFDSFGCPCL